MTLQGWQGCGAVVTGGASGLGAASAQFLAQAGLKPVLFDTDAGRGGAHARAIGATFCTVDVTDPDSIAAGLHSARQAVGTVRVLVNCAGIGGAQKTVAKGRPHDPQLFEKIMRVNLFGSFSCASQMAAGLAGAAPIDDDGTRGVIIHTASIAAFDGQAGQVAYAASKGAIVSMTLPMARDLARHGIRVCTIAPGLFVTPLLDELPGELRHSLARQVPFPARLGDPREYAQLVGQILANPMLNGEVVRLDGAIRMMPL